MKSNENILTGKKEVNSSFNWLNKEIKIFGSKLSNEKKLVFYSELLTLLEAGLPIYTCLTLIVDQSKKESDKKVFQQLLDYLIEGSSFWEALKHTKQFSAFEYFSIKIGEDSGKIQEVLRKLEDYYQGKIEQKRLLVSTLSYPVIVLITAFFAVGFMLKFLVPMFQDVFLQLGNELPAITKFVIYLSDGFGSFILFVSAFWLALFLLYQWKKESDRFKEFSSNLLLKIPIIGELVRKTILIQFCQTLQLLLQARIPLSTALSLLERMIPFYPIKKSLVIVQKSLLEGKQFHESLALFSIYDTKLITLVKVAEESNQLHMIFEKLNIQYQHELKHKTKLLSTIIEPAIIILLGGVIAFILVAMYLPMFSISSSFM